MAKPRVLVIRGGAIGDFILTVPAIQLLRSGLPVTPELHLLGYRPVTDLATAAGLCDASRSIEHAALARFFVPDADLDPEWLAYLGSFDIVVSYLFDPDQIFETNLGRTSADLVLTWPGKVDPNTGCHAATQLAKPLESLALYLDDPAPDLRLPASTRPASIPADAHPLVAIHPGSGSARKNWGFENWLTVASNLHRHHPDTHFLVTTGEAEEDSLPDLKNLLATNALPHTLLHNTPLTELAGHLAHADLFLGHDSGISHLAAALGRPTIAVFGPTDPAVWAPQNPGVTVVQAPHGKLGALEPATVTTSALVTLS